MQTQRVGSVFAQGKFERQGHLRLVHAKLNFLSCSQEGVTSARKSLDLS